MTVVVSENPIASKGGFVFPLKKPDRASGRAKILTAG
jgi:hypothetical protein